MDELRFTMELVSVMKGSITGSFRFCSVFVLTNSFPKKSIKIFTGIDFGNFVYLFLSPFVPTFHFLVHTLTTGTDP